jgi:hypothetical protein
MKKSRKYIFQDPLLWLTELIIMLKLAQMLETDMAIEKTGISYWDALCLAGTILQEQKQGAMVM